MSFTPILSDLAISSISGNANYRNASREAQWGTPVYFTPSSYAIGVNGYGGPKYQEGKNYNNSTSSIHGNCTWWCCGRLLDAQGTHIEYNMSPAIADAKNWYAYYTGTKYTNANSIVQGDIIVLSDSGAGHVMFVEYVNGNTVYISESAYSTRAVWNGYACRVTSYQKSEIYAGASLDMYKGFDSAYYLTVVGIIHTGSDSPTPPTPTTVPTITVTPSSYSVTMQSAEDYKDFSFSISITGIPSGESASGGNTYPDLSRVYNTGWTYTNYTVGGVQYQTATKQQTLRYYRVGSGAYTTTKHMYFSKTFSNGSINSDTPMYINVKAKFSLTAILGKVARKRKRMLYEIK